MTLFLRFATPKSVFAIVTSEHLASVIDRTSGAEQTGLCLATHSRLGPLGLRGEKQFGSTLTYRIIHPVHRWLNIEFEGFKS
jgi:hypothetical protein